MGGADELGCVGGAELRVIACCWEEFGEGGAGICKGVGIGTCMVVYFWRYN